MDTLPTLVKSSQPHVCVAMSCFSWPISLSPVSLLFTISLPSNGLYCHFMSYSRTLCSSPLSPIASPSLEAVVRGVSDEVPPISSPIGSVFLDLTSQDVTWLCSIKTAYSVNELCRANQTTSLQLLKIYFCI